MAAHALIGPSSAHRWLQCPGSIAANKDKPWEQSVYALEGTTAHGLLEVCLRLHCEPEEFLGQVLDTGLLPIDEDMVDAVGYALDYIRAYMGDHPKAELTIEKPVYPGKLLGVPSRVIWGTPDVQLSTPGKELATIDYKHGSGIVVAVKDNPQIKIYHLGKRAEAGRYPKYRSVVIQPRVPRRRPVQEATITDSQLVQWADDTVKPALQLALSDDAPRKAGDWCRYCHASGNCPAQVKQAFERASKDFKKAQDPKTLTPAQVGAYLQDVAMVEEAVASLKALAIRAAHAGVKIPGWVPSWTRSRRVWRDEAEAQKALRGLKLKPAEFMPPTLVSPRKAEDLLKAKKIIAPTRRGQPRPTSPLAELVAYSEQNPSIEKERE